MSENEQNGNGKKAFWTKLSAVAGAIIAFVAVFTLSQTVVRVTLDSHFASEAQLKKQGRSIREKFSNVPSNAEFDAIRNQLSGIQDSINKLEERLYDRWKHYNKAKN